MLFSIFFSALALMIAHLSVFDLVHEQQFRYINTQTATKIWLRYYLEQVFGVRWRKYGRRYTRRRKKYSHDEYNEPNVRFYKATATTDYSECDCTDI